MNGFRRIAITALGIIGFAAGVQAAEVNGQKVLASETGLAYNQTYPMDVSASKNVAMQTVASSASIAAQTFSDGAASTASITVKDYLSLSTAAATGKFTVMVATGLTGTQGVGVVGVSSAVAANLVLSSPNSAQVFNYSILGNVSSGTAATTLAAAINSTNTGGLVFTATAPATGAISNVTITCLSSGTFCNSYTMTSTASTSISTAAFTGGTDVAYISLNGQKLLANQQWAVGASTAITAGNIATALGTFFPTNVVSTASIRCGVDTAGQCGVVYTTAAAVGVAGNYSLFSSVPASISTSAPTMTGGQDAARVSINGVTFTAFGTTNGFNAAVSTAATANSLALAITRSSATDGVIATTSTQGSSVGVIFATATAVGSSTNYALFTSSQAGISLAGPASVFVTSATSVMTGGLTTAYSVGSASITMAGNLFTTALPVLYTTGTVAINPLVWGTTYYAIPVDASHIALATTSALAQAGTGILITSSNTPTTGDTYTLTPLTISGTPSFRWQVSNDRTNWIDLNANVYNIAVSSVTMSSFSSAGTVTGWDLGPLDYNWLRLNVIAPTAGGISLKAYVASKP